MYHEGLPGPGYPAHLRRTGSPARSTSALVTRGLAREDKNGGQEMPGDKG